MFISLYTGFNYRMIEIEVPVEDLISPTPPLPLKSFPSGYEHYNSVFTAYRPSRRDAQQGRPRCRLCVVTRERAQQEYDEEERHAFAVCRGSRIAVRSDGVGNGSSSARSLHPSLSPSERPTLESKWPDIPSGPHPDSKLTPSSASVRSTAMSTSTTSSCDPTTPNPLPITKVTPRMPRSPSVISTTTRPKSTVRSKTPTRWKLSGGVYDFTPSGGIPSPCRPCPR